MLSNSAKRAIREVVRRHLGSYPEPEAFANGLIRAASQFYRNRDADEGAAPRWIQRKRMEKLARLLRSIEQHTGTFTAHDWRNLFTAGRLPPDLQQLTEAWLLDLATAAENADLVLARPGKPTDSGLWVFVYWAVRDFELFMDAKASYAERSTFVALLREVLPLVNPEWSNRDARSVARDVITKSG